MRKEDLPDNHSHTNVYSLILRLGVQNSGKLKWLVKAICNNKTTLPQINDISFDVIGN